MNNTVFFIALFGILINLATGLVTVAVVDVNNNQIFNGTDLALLPTYDSNGTTFFITETADDINPAGVAEDRGNLVFRLLDLIGLGFINKLLSLMDHYLYGFVNVLNSMFGVWLADNPALYAFLFGVEFNVTTSSYIPIGGAIKVGLTVAYVLAVIQLWTNKSITD